MATKIKKVVLYIALIVLALGCLLPVRNQRLFDISLRIDKGGGEFTAYAECIFLFYLVRTVRLLIDTDLVAPTEEQIGTAAYIGVAVVLRIGSS